MAERREVYKCNECGNIVEVLDGGAGQLVCCGQPMEKLDAKSVDQGKEKHVPVIEKIDGGVRVKVGSVAHPMEDEHYIEWIEVTADGKTCRQFLKPGDEPQAEFKVDAQSLTAREHCNVHGLWQGD